MHENLATTHYTQHLAGESTKARFETNMQIGTRLFRQREGIPQGSKISSMLCSIFYAALERQYLQHLSKPGSASRLSCTCVKADVQRLLRYIDDFLHITDDYDAARRFINTMSTGFPEYGAFVSSSKTLTSFEHARGSQVVPVCPHKIGGGSCESGGVWSLLEISPFAGF